MTPELINNDVRDMRLKAGLTPAQAASVVYVHIRTWQRWESGESQMPRATRELFTLRTGDPNWSLEPSE